MLRSRPAVLRLMLLAVLATSVVALPAQAEPDTSRLEELQSELQDLRDGVQRREGAVAELDQRARSLRGDQERARQRLEEIEAELSLVVERYNQAVVALEEVQAQRSATRDELRAVSAEVAALEAAVGEHARRLHKLGPTVEFSTFIGSDSPADLGFKGSTLRRILAGEQADLEEVAAARVRLDALEARLAEREAAADAAAAEVQARVEQVEATHARHEGELHELAAIVDDVESQWVAESDRLAGDQRQLAEQQRAVQDEQAAVEAERQRLEAERREQERREREQRAAEEQRAARQQEAERDQERQAQEQREAEQRAAERRERARRDRERQTAAATPTSSPSSGGSSTSSGSSGSGSSGGSGSAARRSAQVAVETALAQVGKPYQWGATGPGSFDCSGLTSYAWRAAGVTIPRTSSAQYSGLRKVSRSQLQPGDLVFYNSPISHVAMYVGGDTIVEAPRTGIPVRTARLSARSPVGYARP